MGAVLASSMVVPQKRIATHSPSKLTKTATGYSSFHPPSTHFRKPIFDVGFRTTFEAGQTSREIRIQQCASIRQSGMISFS